MDWISSSVSSGLAQTVQKIHIGHNRLREREREREREGGVHIEPERNIKGTYIGFYI